MQIQLAIDQLPIGIHALELDALDFDAADEWESHGRDQGPVELGGQGLAAVDGGNAGSQLTQEGRIAIAVANIQEEDDILESDLVICMTEHHRMRLGKLPKVFTLDQLTGCGDIKDPYGGDEKVYKECLAEILAALKKLMPIIKRQLTL